MNIIKIIPQGFCKGVVCAIKQLNKIIKEGNYKKPLYMLGGIVHNQHILDAFEELGVTIINDYSNIKEGSIIITAHGLSQKKRNEILSKGLDIIDTTCKEVKLIQDIIKEKINQNYSIVYFGSSKHPECKSILEDNEEIHLIQEADEVSNLNISNDKIFFASQTTASHIDVQKAYNNLIKKYPYANKIIDICSATKQRQNALRDKAKICDLVIVVGDKKSNNTMMLKEIASIYTKAILIENLEEVHSISFDNINTLGITAGASTPNILVDEIIKTILDKNHISHITNQDYINI